MSDLREACEEWLDDLTTDEADLDDLVTFVQAQRLDAARDVLECVTQVLCDSGLDSSKSLTASEVKDALRAIRDSIEREGA